jgi:hypothetical protein
MVDLIKAEDVIEAVVEDDVEDMDVGESIIKRPPCL